MKYEEMSREELLEIVLEMDEELGDKDTEISKLSYALYEANSKLDELQEIINNKQNDWHHGNYIDD